MRVLLQTAALRLRSYGEQWLNTIPPHAGRLLRGQSGRQLRQEAWDAPLAAEARLNNRRDPMAAAAPQASAAAFAGSIGPGCQPGLPATTGDLQD